MSLSSVEQLIDQLPVLPPGITGGEIDALELTVLKAMAVLADVMILTIPHGGSNSAD